MIFIATALKGVFIIEPERREDARGFFARTWCQQEAAAHGLNPCVVQCNVSFNKKKGTLRGIHYQAAPCAEEKLVRCTMGSIYDVIIDIRPESPTFKQHLSIVLTAQNRRILYVPKGLRMGFRPWRITRRCFTRCPSSMPLNMPGESDGMIQHLVSSGRPTSA